MTQVTETEYETTEREVTRYKCDHCGTVVDEEDISTAYLYEGHAASYSEYGDVSPDEGLHLCEDCIGLRRALAVREKEEYLKARWNGFRGKIDYYLPLLTGIVGTAMGVGTIWMVENGGINGGVSLFEQILGSVFIFWLAVGVSTSIIFLFFENLKG